MAESVDRRSGTADEPRALASLKETKASAGIRSSGRALPGSERHLLEQAYGVDLAPVRIHDSPAERGHAHAIGATAFASGAHIVHARRGALPAPHVLAHEVAHVVQAGFDRSAPVIQRYESPEHEDLGDSALVDLRAFLATPEGEAWAKKQGLDATKLAAQIDADPLKKAGGKIVAGTRMAGGKLQAVGLTPGEIISLSGDFYDGPDAIAAAARQPLGKAEDKNEIDQLKDAIDQERKGKLSDPNQTYETITGGRYLDLAKKNDTHFAPRNRTEWRRLHDQALAEAAKAGSSKSDLDHALLVDASGGHFLTDSFASGHLFRKNEVLAAIQLHLATHPLRTYNPEAQLYAAIVSWSGNADQLVLKNIHDRMNVEGFEITNARGMKWRSYGDSLLAKAPDTQRIGALAVFLSRQQVYAAQRGEAPDPKEVEDLMPDDSTLDSATLHAIAYVPQAASAQAVQELMNRGRKLAGSQFPFPIGPIVESNLAAITDPGRDKQFQRMEDARRANDLGPMLAPQFSIPIPLP